MRGRPVDPCLVRCGGQEAAARRGGEVRGVIVGGDNGADVGITARRGVILGCGGFAADPAMGRNYLRLPHPVPWGSPGNTGDGIKMAQLVGADLAHPYNYMQMAGLSAPPYQTGFWAEPADGRFIYVGADGRRFIDESQDKRHGKSPVRGMFDFHPGTPTWTVFDEDGRLAGPLVPPRAVCSWGWMTQIERYEWSQDNRVEIERGWINQASTVEDLARQLGIDPDGLVSEVDRYNRWVADGVDDPMFGRPGTTMRPISKAPFYGFAWAQLLITTLGGLRKDGRARVLDPFGEPIPGLYCAGDVASSYTWLLSGGMGLGDALAFGRIAGREAAALEP